MRKTRDGWLTLCTGTFKADVKAAAAFGEAVSASSACKAAVATAVLRGCITAVTRTLAPVTVSTMSEAVGRRQGG